MRPQHLIVAGAGIGGLTAAIALARAGHTVEVLEQAPALGEIGAGVTLAPNAMRVYHHLGLAEAITTAGVEPQRQRVQHWADGRDLVAFERGQKVRDLYGAPYVYIHRADLHAILVEALEATGRATVRLSSQCVAADPAAAGAIAVLADGTQIKGDAVIGADGVKSGVRKGFDPGEPHFTGHVVWRAIVPVEGDLLTDMAHFPGIHIGPGRMAVRYPLRNSTLLNLVFFARQEGWAEEGWTIRADLADLRATFEGWSGDVQALLDAVDPSALYKWAVFARQPLTTWVRGGRVALLGDAAHAMTPFLGQGAAAAIEDALVLARAFEAASDVPEALARYETARKERCGFIQVESNLNADRLEGDEAHLYGMTEIKHEETLGLVAYDAGTVEV